MPELHHGGRIRIGIEIRRAFQMLLIWEEPNQRTLLACVSWADIEVVQRTALFTNCAVESVVKRFVGMCFVYRNHESRGLEGALQIVRTAVSRKAVGRQRLW
jgi:hypothetical protein